ncbi:hypothetical protein P3T76_006041 [Phytophthora citrophthora]|uniref:Uncharacterized protein n=1 Tax=Phytophthora citrophthora TaxID=4793 RepID=A0AAD9GPV3_9STRA|nr:hypothetical protein P3T76_006041 [Phytophthora citrophthora]
MQVAKAVEADVPFLAHSCARRSLWAITSVQKQVRASSETKPTPTSDSPIAEDPVPYSPHNRISADNSASSAHQLADELSAALLDLIAGDSAALFD